MKSCCSSLRSNWSNTCKERQSRRNLFQGRAHLRLALDFIYLLFSQVLLSVRSRTSPNTYREPAKKLAPMNMCTNCRSVKYVLPFPCLTCRCAKYDEYHKCESLNASAPLWYGEQLPSRRRSVWQKAEAAKIEGKSTEDDLLRHSLTSFSFSDFCSSGRCEAECTVASPTRKVEDVFIRKVGFEDTEASERKMSRCL